MNGKGVCQCGTPLFGSSSGMGYNFRVQDVFCFSIFIVKLSLIVHIFTKIKGNSWMNPFVPLAGVASLCFLYFQRQVVTSKCYVFDSVVVRGPLHPN